MIERNVHILKAKEGEFKALAQTRDGIARRILPLFEVGRLTDDILRRKYLAGSPTPTATYLDRVVGNICKSWHGRPAMIDAYAWAADAITENGDHVIAHMVRKLQEVGVPIIPVIGYDRWGSEVYKTSMKGMSLPVSQATCLRLDSNAIEDSAEPEFFLDSITEIIDSLNLFPSQCSILIDFGDVSGTPISDLMDGATRIIGPLTRFRFRDFATVACSIPNSINLAVSSQDSTNMVIRREMILWKALRQEFKGSTILYGDYGVRGPTTNDNIRTKYMDGKIRYTIDQQTLIVRGHPFVNDHNADQMYELADRIVKSPHYLGSAFSWGDDRISNCCFKRFKGGMGDWIAIDTNHHLAYATQEVEAFERGVLVADWSAGV